jgi:PilZ domain
MQPGEKRKNPRRLVSYPAFIDLGDDRPAVKCALCDASQEGAQLAVADPAALPDEFILALSSDGAARRRCRVTWRAEDSIGVQFLKDVKNGARAIRRPVAQVAPEQAPPTAPQAAEDQVDIDDLAGR